MKQDPSADVQVVGGGSSGGRMAGGCDARAPTCSPLSGEVSVELPFFPSSPLFTRRTVPLPAPPLRSGRLFYATPFYIRATEFFLGLPCRFRLCARAEGGHGFGDAVLLGGYAIGRFPREPAPAPAPAS